MFFQTSPPTEPAMKIARILFAAVALVVAASACDSSPTAPTSEQTFTAPIIGSGTGT
jgi:hypothetical protein